MIKEPPKSKSIMVEKDSILVLTDEYSNVRVVKDGLTLTDTGNEFWHGSPFLFKKFKPGSHFSSNPITSGIWVIDSLALGGRGSYNTSKINPTMYVVDFNSKAKILKDKMEYKGIELYSNAPNDSGLETVCEKYDFDAVYFSNKMDGHAGEMKRYMFVNNPNIIRLIKAYKVYVVDVGLKLKDKHNSISNIQLKRKLFDLPIYVEVKT